ncbi:chaperone modulator CbpM [Pseudorhodoferax sp.]|uniref:chaperone modulator CbpM n=1 Tax=Pseudorhodoferax sp. TaxID=1993553 RepID=UPI002DD6535D|nr:chaperone modulator CbpM [Pseudorhodoferax sp.]
MPIRQTTVSVVHCVPVDDDHPLRADELARAAGDRLEWVLELVEAGVIAPTAPEAPRAQWVFRSEALHGALQVRRLQRDFDVGVDAAALIVDLQREVRRLRALLGG